MSVAVITVLTLLFLFLLFFSGMGIGLAMALAGFIGFALLVSFKVALNLVAVDVFSMFSSYTYTCVPLFIFMGQIAARAGIAKRIYDCTHKFIGHVPGGLAIGTVVAGTLFKAICGSTVATVATFATVALPEMNRYKYDKGLSTGVVACVGTLGAFIPPAVCTDHLFPSRECVHRPNVFGGDIAGVVACLFLYRYPGCLVQNKACNGTKGR